MMKGIPILETPRLILRGLDYSDTMDLQTFLSDPELFRWDDLEVMPRPEDVQHYIGQMIRHADFNTGLRWAMVLQPQNRVIGTLGFYRQTGIGVRLGYHLGVPWQNKGYMTEALRTVLGFIFTTEHQNRAEALVLPENLPSQKLLERCGFTREGLLRQYMFFKGRFHDMYIYSILNSDYGSHHGSTG